MIYQQDVNLFIIGRTELIFVFDTCVLVYVVLFRRDLYSDFSHIASMLQVQVYMLILKHPGGVIVKQKIWVFSDKKELHLKAPISFC